MALYPGGSTSSPEWQAIRAFIRARAGDRCEQCGVKNGLVGVRLDDGSFVSYPGFKSGLMVTFPLQPGPPFALFVGKTFKIVCTVAHVDHGLTNHHTENLRFWCQQCHNRRDALDRAAGIRQRKKDKSSDDEPTLV